MLLLIVMWCKIFWQWLTHRVVHIYLFFLNRLVDCSDNNFCEGDLRRKMKRGSSSDSSSASSPPSKTSSVAGRAAKQKKGSKKLLDNISKRKSNSHPQSFSRVLSNHSQRQLSASALPQGARVSASRKANKAGVLAGFLGMGRQRKR